jgi:hypothetical protein
MLVGVVFLCFAVGAAAQGGKCVSPIECNARLCMDCSCDDGTCSCGDGWSDLLCQTPFCKTREDGCNGHGTCKMTLTSITCVCDFGYSGSRCEQKHCTLDCSHGGEVNGACSQCDGCAGAWRGARDDGVPFYALPNDRVRPDIQTYPIHAYDCKGTQVFRASQPDGCTVGEQNVFWSPRNDPKAVNITEFVDASGKRVWRPNATAPAGFSLVGSFFQGYNTMANMSSEIWASTLCINGGCSSGLSQDSTKRKACLWWDNTVSSSDLLAASFWVFKT